jgi:hypothetical protein
VRPDRDNIDNYRGNYDNNFDVKPPPVRFSGFLIKTLISPDTEIGHHFFRIETVFGETLLHVRHCRRGIRSTNWRREVQDRDVCW